MPIKIQNNKAETLSQNQKSSFNKIFTKLFVYVKFSLNQGIRLTKIPKCQHRQHIG